VALSVLYIGMPLGGGDGVCVCLFHSLSRFAYLTIFEASSWTNVVSLLISPSAETHLIVFKLSSESCGKQQLDLFSEVQ